MRWKRRAQHGERAHRLQGASARGSHGDTVTQRTLVAQQSVRSRRWSPVTTRLRVHTSARAERGRVCAEVPSQGSHEEAENGSRTVAGLQSGDALLKHCEELSAAALNI